MCGGGVVAPKAGLRTHKATGIVVAHGLGVAEGLEQWV